MNDPEVFVLIRIFFLVASKQTITQTDLTKRKKLLGYAVGKFRDFIRKLQVWLDPGVQMTLPELSFNHLSVLCSSVLSF